MTNAGPLYVHAVDGSVWFAPRPWLLVGIRSPATHHHESRHQRLELKITDVSANNGGRRNIGINIVITSTHKQTKTK